MKIEGVEKTERRVEIDVRDEVIFDIFIRRLYHNQGIKDISVYEKDGKLVTEVEHWAGAGHSWFDEQVVIETPTPEQLEVVALRVKLGNLYFSKDNRAQY